MLNRRKAIKLAGGLGTAALVPGTRAIAASSGTLASKSGTLSIPPFTVPMPIPPVVRPTRQTDTTDYYDVDIAATTAEIFPGVQTSTLTYNGSFPAPTIYAPRDRQVVVTNTNSLDDETVVHLHGAHLSAENDGHPMDMIAPGQQRAYEYPNAQPGATLWYHAHPHHTEAEQVYRGLAGFYLLQDPDEAEFGLPGGEFDVPVMLRDARFDDSGQFVFVMNDFLGRKTLLANGKPQPYFQVAARKYRFRFLNGSNERIMRLQLSDQSAMQVIGSDSGLLPAPVSTPFFDLWPGERVEAVIDFARYPEGTQIVLTNLLGEDDRTKSVMRFDVGGTADDPSTVPPTLRPLPDLGTPTVNRDIHFQFDPQSGMFPIDGKLFDPNRVDQQIRLNTTEIWTITNDDPRQPHNMHLHMAQFQVLDRNGKPVSGPETGLKDTVDVPPRMRVRIKVRFADYTGRFVYHCHLLDHSAMGMMAQMEIS